MTEIDLSGSAAEPTPLAEELPVPDAAPSLDDVEPRPSVDYLLRTTQQNLVQLSVMADQKANIVLGAAFIMITVIVGVSSSSGLTAGLAVLGGFTTISSIVALLAVMPTIPRESRTPKSNPLFFADIATMTRQEHADELAKHLIDDDHMYALIARDIHESANVLQHRKFKYLRIAYWVFIVGLLATSATVLIEWMTGAI